MANLCIKTPSSAILVLIFQLLVLRPRPNDQTETNGISCLGTFVDTVPLVDERSVSEFVS